MVPLAAQQPLWKSSIVRPDTPSRAVSFDVDLAGAKKVWLMVDDSEDGFTCDWADWMDPKFKGLVGERALVDLDWKEASSQWGQVRKNMNVEGGALRVDGKSVARGIGTHAKSVIEFDVPEGMNRLVGAAGLDDGGANQGGGSIRFSIYTQAPKLTVVKSAGGPVDPQDGPGTLVTPEDLEVTLFAAEPLLSSPSNIDIDSKGRVWVCEVVNYRGKQNTRKEGDRILVLEDTDADGKADKQTVFYQGRDIDSALGLCVVNGPDNSTKVIVSCAPEVMVFCDDTGDLVSDRKETLFTKTGTPQHDHSVHAFTVGPDGRYYFNFGNTGQAVHDAAGQPVVDLAGNTVNDSGKPYRQGMVFRCLPDGSKFEVLGHNFRNNYEVATDSFGTLWQSDNDDDGNRGVRINFVMEYGNYGYVDERTGAGWQIPRVNFETEIPQRHWHQNDPGVVPNLLITGAGSPTGICVYEGNLLPARFMGSMLHCDAGPNIMRAYHVTSAGAGFQATIENVVDGVADRWFRPSDVCVAPDGSVFVADWYDPGVGGHGMADTEKGRIYRVAPQGSRYRVAPVDFDTVAGAVKAIGSPNLSTRATALNMLRTKPVEAASVLEKEFASSKDPRLAARLAWAAGMLPGQCDLWVNKLSDHSDENLRIVALRLCRAAGGKTESLLAKLVKDPSSQVRREAAIALRGRETQRDHQLWAELAAQHVVSDRYEIEALGIGADGQWDGRLKAWKQRVQEQWKSPAGREIVWRSRGEISSQWIAELLADPSTSTAESLALIRAFDFQDSQKVREALKPLVANYQGPHERTAVILPELIIRLDRSDAENPAIAKRINEAIESVLGTERFVELIKRFELKDRVGSLIELAESENVSDVIGSSATSAVIGLGGEKALEASLLRGDASSIRVLQSLGMQGQGKSVELVEKVLRNEKLSSDMRAAAVRAMAKTNSGAKILVAMAKKGELTGVLPQAAAMAISSSPWADVRQDAATVLPLPKGRGGEKLPPVVELLKRTGNVAGGKLVFAGVGTCAKCHVVGNEGKAVGPNLSGIGAKLSREALYESVLAPSAAVSHNYETWTAVLDDGRAITGMLVSKTPDKIVIKGPDAIDIEIDAKTIEELAKQPLSLMPADLAGVLSSQELVDVVAWMETLRQASP